MWREATVYCLDATPGYNHNPLDQGAGKRGVMILLAPRWSHVISHQGSILVNRAHYFALLGLLGGTIDFINVYAPNDPSARCELWTALAIELLPADCWLLLEDFNMVEHQ